jgi:methyl-CpG-binding domain protein 4
LEREILIQEEYLDDPWKMMVCCILLNQTNNKQVRPILSSLFNLIPDPESAIRCNPESIAAVIKTTGFQNVKSSRIIKLSQKWISGFQDVRDLPGIGQYGKDSWEIFINRNLSIQTKDKKLLAYLSFF